MISLLLPCIAIVNLPFYQRTLNFCRKILKISLSKEAIDEFKQIYKKEFGKDLSDYEALKMGTDLLRLFKVIYRPIAKRNR